MVWQPCDVLSGLVENDDYLKNNKTILLKIETLYFHTDVYLSVENYYVC